jgi:DNA-binding transcriptional MerR regulator
MSTQHAAPTTSPSAGKLVAGGVYSIGAVASMLGVPAATLRSWEERYGVISPERTKAGHRLYTREQVEQLRFIVAEIDAGASAADAHRALTQWMLEGEGRAAPAHARPRLLILVAERDGYSAELIEFLLRTEGFGVEVALDVDEAKLRFPRVRPDLVIVELLVGGGAGMDLCGWFKEHGTAPVLVLSGLDAADRALAAGADAFLPKPVGHLKLVSVVKDLLGVSALLVQGP